MIKAYKYRIKPTARQKVLIDKHVDSCRLLFNLGLEVKTSTYNSQQIQISKYELMSQIPDLKREFSWLKEINSQCLQQQIHCLDDAFIRFFKGQNNFPKFKKKSTAGSFTVPQNIKITDSKIVIPKFIEGIKTVFHRPPIGTIKRATISKTATGKYFVSLICEDQTTILSPIVVDKNTTIGIDLGVKSFIISSSGEEVKNPKFLQKSQTKLKYISRKFSKRKGKKTQLKLAIIHEKIANQRKDFLQKTSSKLIRDNQTICIEDLNIKGMISNHKLAKSISDCSWYSFLQMLTYKAEWYGKTILKIGRFEPSSKTCSVCGTVNKELKLSDRVWRCSSCNTTLDRDINAAINIKNFALKNQLSTGYRLKNQNELPIVIGVLTSEAHAE